MVTNLFCGYLPIDKPSLHFRSEVAYRQFTIQCRIVQQLHLSRAVCHVLRQHNAYFRAQIVVMQHCRSNAVGYGYRNCPLQNTAVVSQQLALLETDTAVIVGSLVRETDRLEQQIVYLWQIHRVQSVCPARVYFQLAGLASNRVNSRAVGFACRHPVLVACKVDQSKRAG